MNTLTEDEVRNYILSELPLVTTLFRKVKPDDDSILQEWFEAEDIADMSESYFRRFNISRDGFCLDDYYPWRAKSFFTGRARENDKKPLTIRMFIDSAKAGRWLSQGQVR
ncbi:TPA: DUF1493 family protein [Enterobacter hormaechei subsp. steigerwaltii]|nr:DUF1493 family protein [Enterobacter hormaechei subsp. steigerwaltii]